MSKAKPVIVWDILIRIFHWSLVISFSLAYMASEESNVWHIYSGYVVLSLIIFRVIWGLVGSKHARFSDFVRPPSAVLAYVSAERAGNAPVYTGHNPLGGWMVMALLGMLFIVTLSGLKVYAIEKGESPFASNLIQLAPINSAHAEDDDENNEEDNKADEEFWEEIHEISSNVMLLLIALHIAGVVISSRVHHENLVKAMITGRKSQN